MKTAIIGLPQVGKTSLFTILTGVATQARLGATAVHLGVARVPDKRLEALARVFEPQKVTHATVEYVDMPALSKESLRDPSYLASLRVADAFAHVLRLFRDASIPHPEGSLDPARDWRNADLELILSDLVVIEKRLERLEKDRKKIKSAELEQEQLLLEKCKAALEAEQPLRELDLDAESAKRIRGFQFLSEKPMLLVLNLGEAQAADLHRIEEDYRHDLLAGRAHTALAAVCGKIEAEIAELGPEEAREYLASYELAESGLERLIHASYSLLGLMSFFTGGDTEVRAWTIYKNSTALAAAGTIHTDFEKKFIRAEVIQWDELVALGGYAGARPRRLTPIPEMLPLLLGLTAALAEVFGGLIIVRRRWERRFLHYFIALGAGFLLAAVFLEMIPEALRLAERRALFFVLVGYLIVHLAEHTLSSHFHFGEEVHGEEMAGAGRSFAVLAGLMIHAFFDGIAIASGFLVSNWLGMVLFTAIFLHKIPEGFTVASVMVAGGRGPRTAMMAASLLGVSTMSGVLVMLLFSPGVGVGLPLAVAAGVCIYVAASDLIPEINQQPGIRLALVVFVGVGVLLALRYLLRV
ncbi:MAG: redox-regulated ATPase YchF [Acidobacteria bacterium]|nr:redox-regulated ATPase YchF [Acidobacteriota bacterium]